MTAASVGRLADLSRILLTRCHFGNSQPAESSCQYWTPHCKLFNYLNFALN